MDALRAPLMAYHGTALTSILPKLNSWGAAYAAQLFRDRDPKLGHSDLSRVCALL